MSKRVFTVTVDFTIDLDELKAGVVEDLENKDPEIIKRAEENVDEFWQMSDMELTNIVMDDITSALDDVGMRAIPVRFQRHQD